MNLSINQFIQIYQYWKDVSISKIVIYKCCYDYMKPKYGEKSKLCLVDADIDTYVDNVGKVKTGSNYELDNHYQKNPKMYWN